MACAAQAEAPIVLGAQTAEPAAWFAPIIAGMQRASAEPASFLSRLGGKIPITCEEKIMEGGVRQQGCIQRYILPRVSSC